MTLIERFQAFLQERVPDPRILLCDVGIQGGALQGVADRSLEADLYAFAAGHGIGAKVDYPGPGETGVLGARVFLRNGPEAEAEVVSEALYGERLRVYDRREEFVRVATARDDYLGWVPLAAVTGRLPEPSHRFGAPRGHVFAAPTVKAKPLLELSWGVGLRVQGTEGEWSRVAFGRDQSGYVRASLLAPLEAPLGPAEPRSVVAFARRFLQSPYIWGGVSAWGLDCSGLAQTVFAAHGVALPRDADQQEQVGEEIAFERVRAGDLLFFPGHVALAVDEKRFLHANANFMRVTVDGFEHGAYGTRLREQLRRARRFC